MRLQDLDCVVSHRRLLPAVSIRREIHHREVCASDLRHRERNRREDAPRHARSAALPARRRVHLRDPRALQTGRGLTKGLVAIVRLAGSQWIQMLERRASLVGCLCMNKEKRERERERANAKQQNDGERKYTLKTLSFSFLAWPWPWALG